jgi:hypothetical protein
MSADSILVLGGLIAVFLALTLSIAWGSYQTNRRD